MTKQAKGQATKGPWVVVIEPDRPFEPAIMSGEWYVATAHHTPGDGDVSANAALLASAPVLHEALSALVDHYVALVNSGDAGHWNPEAEMQVKQARAAIRKATGEPE